MDGDGTEELFVACDQEQDRLLRTDEHGYWFDDTTASLPLELAAASGALAVDLDLDGLPELIVPSDGDVTRFYQSDGERFVDRTPDLSLAVGDDVAALANDIDGDGDLDLLLPANAGNSRLYVMKGD